MEDPPDYVSLTRTTVSESTEYEYYLELSGYQLKYLIWCLKFIEATETNIGMLDASGSTIKRLISNIESQIDDQGVEKDPEVKSKVHLHIMSKLLE